MLSLDNGLLTDEIANLANAVDTRKKHRENLIWWSKIHRGSECRRGRREVCCRRTPIYFANGQSSLPDFNIPRSCCPVRVQIAL